jgi:hypothetical protein
MKYEECALQKLEENWAKTQKPVEVAYLTSSAG